MKVSIIVAAHNAEEELFRCVSSLVEQTLEDVEIILVDDASTDGTRDLMADYQSQFPEQIQCVYLEERAYPGGAKNRGMEVAAGEYIAFVDSCDWVEPGMCEDLYYAAKGADMCGADYWTDRSGVRKDVYPNYGPGTEMNEEKRFVFLNGCGSYASRIYNRAFLEKNDLRFPEGTRYDDSYFVFMTALYAETVVKTESRYYHLVGSEESVPFKERWQRLELPGRILEDCKAREIYEDQRDLIDYKYIAMQMGNIRNLCLKVALAPAKKRLAQIASDVWQHCPNFDAGAYYKRAPWNLRAYLRLTLVSPGLAAFVRPFDWLVNLCASVHDMIVKR